MTSLDHHHVTVDRSALGPRAFSVAGPRAWNALPAVLRGPTRSSDSFRSTLKTFLFAEHWLHVAHYRRMRRCAIEIYGWHWHWHHVNTFLLQTARRLIMLCRCRSLINHFDTSPDLCNHHSDRRLAWSSLSYLLSSHYTSFTFVPLPHDRPSVCHVTFVLSHSIVLFFSTISFKTKVPQIAPFYTL